MSSKWEADKKWADGFIPEITTAIAPHIIGESPVDEDMLRNTDLTVITAAPARVACRIRRPNPFMRHSFEFTMRTARPNGTKTELQKVIEGWAGHMFYGVSDPAGQRLRTWMLLDLNVFRVWMARYLHTHSGRLPGIEKTNGDGTKFRVFDARELPPEFVVGRFGALERS